MKSKDKIYLIVIIFTLIITLLPLIYIAKFNHSCADDYSYGKLTYHTWKETHSIIEVIKTAMEQVKITYGDWQGTFSAIFLMALQPAIFGEQFYGITTVLLIFTFVFANIYLIKVILKEYLQTKKEIYWIISALVIIFSIQFLPYPVESFYWYNGSIYYTLFYSLMLIFIGTILKLIKTEKCKRRNIYFSISIILAIIIGSGNYTTALVTNLIIATIMLVLIMKKDKNYIYIGIITLICLVTLLISALAPGNQIRQNGMDKMGEIEAIFTSFKYAIIFIGKYTNKSIIWLYVFLIPILIKIIKKTNYKFKMPLLFTIITFCIYSAQFTPPIYAQNGYIPNRIFNIIYFSTYWLFIMNIAYWLGVINSKFNIEENQKNNKIIYIILLIVGFLVFMVEYKDANSYIALKSIQTGECYQYDVEMKERIKIYEDEEIQEVEVNKLTVRPYLLFFDDITRDTQNWKNTALSDYYDKKSVRIK